jgi:hypothetical protein
MAQSEVLPWHPTGRTEGTTKPFSQISQSPGKDLNLVSFRYKVGVLPTILSQV